MKKIEVVIAGGGNMKRNVFICILCLLGASCTCGQQLRLLTYNVHNCIGLDNVRDYNRIAEIIRSVDADVVALQELDSVTQRNGGVYALGELERLTDMYGFFAAAIPYQGGSYGIGILSKEKPLSCRIIPMSGREEKRVMVIAEFENYVFCATHQSLTPLDQLLSVKEIVKVLDAASEIIRLRTACIESAQSLIPALFQEMFGDPLSKVDKNKIGYYFDVGTGATPRRENSEYYEGNIPWVKTTEVDNCYINSTSEHISESAIKETNCSLYPPGTILMAMYGQGKTRGKVAYLNINATTNQACAALQLKKEYENDVNLIYVFYYLQIIYEFLRTLSQGGGRPNMNLSIVRNIPLYLPDIKQQELFAKKVQEIEAYIKTQQAELENAKTMFQSLLHHSFTGELTRRAYGE